MMKCIYCGKFIAHEDFSNGKASSRWIPDTAYTAEETLFFHTDCDTEAAKELLEILGK